MSPFLLLGLLLHALVIRATVFTAPVQPNVEAVFQLLARQSTQQSSLQSRSFEEVLQARRLQRRSQSPMKEDDQYTDSHDHRVEVWVSTQHHVYL